MTPYTGNLKNQIVTTVAVLLVKILDQRVHQSDKTKSVSQVVQLRQGVLLVPMAEVLLVDSL